MKRGENLHQKYQDPAWRQAHAEMCKALPDSEEWRENHAEAMEKRGKPVICLTIGAIYPSAKHAARDLGLSAQNVKTACQGKAKTCGGFRWRYASEFISGVYL